LSQNGQDAGRKTLLFINWKALPIYFKLSTVFNLTRNLSVRVEVQLIVFFQQQLATG